MNRNCFCQPMLLCFFLWIVHSCNFYETELQIDLPAPKPKLVVHSAFTPFTPPIIKSFAVFVSQNTGMFDSLKVDRIHDATISLYIDGQFNQIMKYDTIYGYRVDFLPKADVEYSIKVEKQGFETVTAKGTIPPKVAIKSCELTPFAGLNDEELAFSQLSVTFDDPAN